jgi:anti-anti-sigma regulatory factor
LYSRAVRKWSEMLRVTLVESSSETVRLRVEGRVAGGWVKELRRSCEVHALSDGIRLTLDLADVSFVDADGVELLKELRMRCVTLLSPSPFVAEQLKDVASCVDAWMLDRPIAVKPQKAKRKDAEGSGERSHPGGAGAIGRRGRVREAVQPVERTPEASLRRLTPR